MICERCGHEIGPEQLKCPYCDADNPFAVQHEKNMRGFKNKYEATEREVRGFTKSVEGLGKKAAILIVLLIGSIIMIVIASLNGVEHDEDEVVRRDAVKHAVSYAEEADGFLERGEYIEYVSFLYAHELMNFPPEEFERFRCVQNVAREYYECIILMENIIFRSDDPDYFDSLDTDIRNFCMYADSFYEVFEAQKSSEKNEVYMGYIMDIETELRAAMRTYFSMDEGELSEFFELSSAKKALKLQEVLRHE
ncbi:MAG: hypothetical protein K6G45_00840 [Lachnospiraceae bacterium]|nr:hypothetical protein [Lachnospiraceae bacterium]